MKAPLPVGFVDVSHLPTLHIPHGLLSFRRPEDPGIAMTSPRRKGKRGELEVAALLRDLLGTAVVRNLTQARDGGHDLIGLPGWSAEVKRAAKPRIAEWWAQAVGQANGAKPVLLYRTDRRPWRAVVALADVVPAFEGQTRHEVTWTLETSLEVFAALVREGLGPVTHPLGKVEAVEASRVSAE